MKWLVLIAGLLASFPILAGPGKNDARQIENRVETIERLLNQWQFIEARDLAQDLLTEHPDLPAVQLVAGWVKFHFAEHQTARELTDRALAAFGGQPPRDFRVELIRSAARLAERFERFESPDGKVVVFHRPGSEEILVPYLVEAVARTIKVVGDDLGYRPDQAVLVEILPDAEALAGLTGLTPEEINTSGTIAVCKYGRLMVTSPRATMKGYGWLDTASHELVHMIISQKTHNRTPIWIHEALAKYEEQRWRAEEPLYRDGLAPHTESNLAKALRTGALITFDQMHPSMALLPSPQAAELAFSEVYMATRFLLSKKGYPGIRALLENLRDGLSDMEAIQRVYGFDKETFVKAWVGWMKNQRLQTLTGDVDLERPADDQRRPGTRAERALSSGRNVDLRDFFHLGQLLRARDRTAASVVEYTKAVQRAGPRHAALWILADKLGVALQAMDRKKEAREVFQSSLVVNPDDLEAHLHIGNLLIEEDPYRAWLHLRECLRINPLDPRVHVVSLKAALKLETLGDTRQDWAAIARTHEQALGLLPGRAGAETGDSSSRPVLKPEENAAILKIHSRPWARVWLDYQDTGLTTPVYRLEVEPGAHVVGLVAACRPEPVTVRVMVSEGHTEVVDLELCPDPQVEPAGEVVR